MSLENGGSVNGADRDSMGTNEKKLRIHGDDSSDTTGSGARANNHEPMDESLMDQTNQSSEWNVSSGSDSSFFGFDPIPNSAERTVGNRGEIVCVLYIVLIILQQKCTCFFQLVCN